MKQFQICSLYYSSISLLQIISVISKVYNSKLIKTHKDTDQENKYDKQ